ncbi:MAG: hypothetical protein AB8I80_22490, partial [Anaerolineae bacterium]
YNGCTPGGMARQFERLGLPRAEATCLDLSAGGAGLPEDFDRILLDVPCTGSGTLRRRPRTPCTPSRCSSNTWKQSICS